MTKGIVGICGVVVLRDNCGISSSSWLQPNSHYAVRTYFVGVYVTIEFF